MVVVQTGDVDATTTASMTRSLFRRVFLCLIAPCFLLTQRSWKKATLASFPTTYHLPSMMDQPTRLRRSPVAASDRRQRAPRVAGEGTNDRHEDREADPSHPHPPRKVVVDASATTEYGTVRERPQKRKKPTLILHHMTSSLDSTDPLTQEWEASVTRRGYRVIDDTSTKRVVGAVAASSSSSSPPCREEGEDDPDDDKEGFTNVVHCGDSDPVEIQLRAFLEQRRQQHPTAAEGVIVLDTSVAAQTSEAHDRKSRMERLEGEWNVVVTAQVEPHFAWLARVSSAQSSRQHPSVSAFPPNLLLEHQQQPDTNSVDAASMSRDSELDRYGTLNSTLREALERHWDDLSDRFRQSPYPDAVTFWERIRKIHGDHPAVTAAVLPSDPLWCRSVKSASSRDDDDACVRAPPPEASMRWSRRCATTTRQDDGNNTVTSRCTNCPDATALRYLREASWRRQRAMRERSTTTTTRDDERRHARAFAAAVRSGAYCRGGGTTAAEDSDAEHAAHSSG